MKSSHPIAGPTSQPADEALVRAAQARDPQALRGLVDRYADSLYSTATYLLGGDAADASDVAQETLMAMVQGIERFEFRSAFRTWLWSILIRQANLKIRQRVRERRAMAAGGPMHPGFRDEPFRGRGSDGPDRSVQIRLDVHAAMARLSDEHRQVLVLREFDGLSYDQIAAVLDIPRGTVESRLHRARLALRDLLHDYASPTEADA